MIVVYNIHMQASIPKIYNPPFIQHSIINMDDEEVIRGMYIAVSEGDEEEVERLLQDDPTRLEVNLYVASGNGHADLVDYLVDKGANIYARNHNQKLALVMASEYSHDEVVSLLLEKHEPHNDISEAVMIASKEGHAEVLRLLLSVRQCHDAQQPGYLNINTKADVNKKTAFHYTCEEGYLDCAQVWS